MTHDMLGDWDFVDEKNGVRARLVFDPPSESGGRAKAPPSDFFAGFLERSHPPFPSLFALKALPSDFFAGMLRRHAQAHMHTCIRK